MMESLLSVKGNNRIALMSMEFGSVTQSTIIFINLLHDTGHYATNNVYLGKTGYFIRGGVNYGGPHCQDTNILNLSNGASSRFNHI